MRRLLAHLGRSQRRAAAGSAGVLPTEIRRPLSLEFRRVLRALQPIEIVSGVHVGRTPDAKGVEALERAGFRSIVDLDVEGVLDQALSPNVEASWAHTFELEHHRVAFYGAPTEADLQRFRETLAAASRPVYVECADRAFALHLVREKSAEPG